MLGRDDAATRRVVTGLVDAGLVEAHGQTRSRSYTLSSKVYRNLGATAAYTRQVGLDTVAQEQAVLQAARRVGPLRRADVAELCKIDPRQASRLLARLVRAGHLKVEGSRKAAVYVTAGPVMTAVKEPARPGHRRGQKRS
jgi:ATP-dependent DNA helicase RecG